MNKKAPKTADIFLYIDILTLCKGWIDREEDSHYQSKKSKHRSYMLGQCAGINRCRQELVSMLKAYEVRRNYEKP